MDDARGARGRSGPSPAGTSRSRPSTSTSSSAVTATPEIRCDPAGDRRSTCPTARRWCGPARLIGVPDIERVAGADFVPQLMEAAAREHLRRVLPGRRARRRAARGRQARRPRTPVCRSRCTNRRVRHSATWTTTRSCSASTRCSRRSCSSRSGTRSRSSGSAATRTRLPMVAVGVGCSLDLIAGLQSRAPVWAHRIGLEWAYRLVHEPRRLFRRYATDATVAARKVLLPWAVSQRRAGSRRGSVPVERSSPPAGAAPPDRPND